MQTAYLLLGLLVLLALLVVNLWPEERLTTDTPDSTVDPGFSASDYAMQLIAHREQLDEFHQLNLESPILPMDKANWSGLSYFPPDTAFRFPGQFTPLESLPDSVNLADLTVGAQTLKAAGTVAFTHQHTRHTLTVYWETTDTPAADNSRGRLFLPFRDATSNQTTYGGGRYLNLELPQQAPGSKRKKNLDSTPLWVDFNYAYNPYCVYNPNYVCPLPPSDNLLPIAIEAGEKNFVSHAAPAAP